MSEQQIVPGIIISSPNKIRRVLRAGNPRGDDLRDAQAWVRDIRSRLGHIRGELGDLGKIEAVSPHDRTCEDVAGALTLAISALYSLVDGKRSFEASAERSDALWADVEANPDDYVIEDGETWDWHPTGIFERGGAASDYAVRFLREQKRECVDDCEGFRDPCVACVVNETLRRLGRTGTTSTQPDERSAE